MLPKSSTDLVLNHFKLLFIMQVDICKKADELPTDFSLDNNLL